MAKKKTEILKLMGDCISEEAIKEAVSRAYPQKTFRISKRRDVYDVKFDKPITLQAALNISQHFTEYIELHEYSNRIFIKF